MNHGFNYTALFGDYTIPGTSLPIGYILSAITAILIFFLISKVLMAVYGSTNKAQINNQPKNKPIEKLPVWLNSERHQVP